MGGNPEVTSGRGGIWGNSEILEGDLGTIWSEGSFFIYFCVCPLCQITLFGLFFSSCRCSPPGSLHHRGLVCRLLPRQAHRVRARQEGPRNVRVRQAPPGGLQDSRLVFWERPHPAVAFWLINKYINITRRRCAACRFFFDNSKCFWCFFTVLIVTAVSS